MRAVFTLCFSARVPEPRLSLTERSPAARPVLAHQVHQDALAQAAIGDAQAVRGEGAADRLKDGAAGEHEVGALAADAGIFGAAVEIERRSGRR